MKYLNSKCKQRNSKQVKLVVALLLLVFFAYFAIVKLAPNNSVVNNSASTSTTASIIYTQSVSSANSPSNFSFNFFNLTGVGYIDPDTKKIAYFITVNDVRKIEVLLNTTSAKPGEYVELNVVYEGNFNWGTPAANYYLDQASHTPLINIHYYGVELANESGKLLVQENGPWWSFVKQVKDPYQPSYKDPLHYFVVRWVVTPTQNMTGKVIKICGGYFAAYEFTKGDFVPIYNDLAYRQVFVSNQSVINIQSQNCALLNVTT